MSRRPQQVVPGRRREFRFPWRTRRQLEREIGEELEFHLESRVEDLIGQGLEAGEARRRAHEEFGDLESARADLTRFGTTNEDKRQRRMIIEELWLDIKYALRSLARTPGFSVVAVAILALGIGVNAAMFGAINLLLLRTSGNVDPERLVSLHSESVERPGSFRMISFPAYRLLRGEIDSLDEVAAHNLTIVGFKDRDVTTRSMAILVSDNYFSMFGEVPAQGRVFTEQECRPGAGVPVVITSHGFWVRQGSPENFVGSTLDINGQARTVVGVTSPGFTGSTAFMTPDFWFPIGSAATVSGGPMAAGDSVDFEDPDNNTVMIMGRLREGQDAKQLQAELDRLGAALEETYPSLGGPRQLSSSPLSRIAVSTDPSDDRVLVGPSILLMAMTGIVLLIACLNLANMFLARGAGRQSEIAVRSSLGSGRGRLVRQMLTESLVLSLLGGLGGLVLAVVASKALLATVGGLMPFGLTINLDLSPDLRVIAVTISFCVLATLAFGLGPALRVTRGDLVGKLRSTLGAGGGAAGSSLAPRNLLIVGQIALSLALLTAGGLFFRGALNAARATPGFALEDSLLVELDPSLVGYDEGQSRETYRRVIDVLETMPDIESVSFASLVPFGAVSSSRGVLPATGELDLDQARRALTYSIGTDYFRTLGLPVMRGRDFTDAEIFDEPTSRVAIIDEPLAEQLWPGQEVIGRQLRLVSSDSTGEPLEVVGVVPGVRHDFFAKTAEPHVYLPYSQRYTANMSLHLKVDERSSRLPHELLATVRDEIRMVDATVPVVALKTMIDHRDQSLFVWVVRAGAKVFAGLGLVALLMALVGIYGVRAFLMSRRTREIGLRMALGATPRGVVGSLVKDGLRPTLIGLAVGAVLALGIAQLLSSMLYQVSALDPLVLVGATTLLLAFATLATYLPARRATLIEPTKALRSE